MDQHTCLVFTRDHDEFEEKLQAYPLPNLEIIIGRNEAIIRKHLARADILFGNPPAISRYIKDAKNVQWVQSSFAGVDALIADDLPKHYILTNVKDTYGKQMAEYVFAYILGLKRQIEDNKLWQTEYRWNQFGYDFIEGKTMGIVGTGSIGVEIARIAKAFGMHTHGLNTQGTPENYIDKTFSRKEMDGFCKNIDYIVSVLPNTPNTKHFFNATAFATMESHAWFLNIGRGQTVCETDLINALKRKQIAGAVLDVFEEEPLPTDSPLWDIPNVYITPHVSGYVCTDTGFEIFAHNYQLFCEGKPLQYQIDFKKGY